MNLTFLIAPFAAVIIIFGLLALLDEVLGWFQHRND